MANSLIVHDVHSKWTGSSSASDTLEFYFASVCIIRYEKGRYYAVKLTIKINTETMCSSNMDLMSLQKIYLQL